MNRAKWVEYLSDAATPRLPAYKVWVGVYCTAPHWSMAGRNQMEAAGNPRRGFHVVPNKPEDCHFPLPPSPGGRCSAATVAAAGWRKASEGSIRANAAPFPSTETTGIVMAGSPPASSLVLQCYYIHCCIHTRNTSRSAASHWQCCLQQRSGAAAAASSTVHWLHYLR